MAAALVSVATGCPEDGPPVTAIEIVPSVAVVGTDPNPTTFTLEARLWTGPANERISISQSQGYARLEWRKDKPWLTVMGDGHRVIVTIEPTAPQGETAVVTVKAGGKTSNPGARIVVGPAMTAGEDILTAPYTRDLSPDLAVVNGIWTASEGCDVRLFALVRSSHLGQVRDQCPAPATGRGAAALFAAQRTVFREVYWSPEGESIDAGPAATLRSLPVALRVMVGGDGLTPDQLTALRAKVMRLARDDIALANSILTDSRMGTELAIAEAVTLTPDVEVGFSDCMTGDGVTVAHDKPGMLNIYYVNNLGAGARGLTCSWRDAPSAAGLRSAVIYVGSTGHSSTTFVHEVGHVLGLTLPGRGHSDLLAGFDYTNVMAAVNWDRDPQARTRFSVGQVFRMNADSASWLTWANDAANIPIYVEGEPRLACRCGEAPDPQGRCPRPVDDIASPSGQVSTAGWGACHDRVALTQFEYDPLEPPETGLPEEPVGLLAGRRLRSVPGKCSDDLRGWVRDEWGRTYLVFDNVTRPGSCSSWVAVFFKRHGLLYRTLAESPSLHWTEGADQWILGDDIPPLAPVPVILHHPTGTYAQAKAAALLAEPVFGAMNRTGIRLDFQYQEGGTCPAEPNNPPPICVDFAPGADLSHEVGKALKLSVLNGTGFSENVMQQDPTKRGSRLTLGQVFRINSALRLVPTACDPGPCPPLDADIPP